jgi:S1-C subfamily serine protease
MVTFNVLDRVFFVRGLEYGTAFTIDIDSKQYLVSARHVIGDDTSISSLKLFHDKTWKDIHVTFVGAAKGEVDISVFSPSVRLSPSHPLEPTFAGLILGQDVYFAGYPYKMWSHGGDLMHGRPLPFLKKGTFSAGLEPNNDVKILYVDAISNEGFSGGPVVFATQKGNDFKVVGVVSKFKTEHEPVIDKEDKETGLRVAYNTGFMVAYGINHVLNLIRANPVGLAIDA